MADAIRVAFGPTGHRCRGGGSCRASHRSAPSCRVRGIVAARGNAARPPTWIDLRPVLGNPMGASNLFQVAISAALISNGNDGRPGPGRLHGYPAYAGGRRAVGSRTGVTGMDDLRCALREIHGGAVAKRLLAEILRWAERDGVLARMRRLSRFTEADLCRTLQIDLGYALGARESPTHDLAPAPSARRVRVDAGGGWNVGVESWKAPTESWGPTRRHRRRR